MTIQLDQDNAAIVEATKRALKTDKLTATNLLFELALLQLLKNNRKDRDAAYKLKLQNQIDIVLNKPEVIELSEHLAGVWSV